MGTDAARNKQQLELSYPMRNGIVQVCRVCWVCASYTEAGRCVALYALAHVTRGYGIRGQAMQHLTGTTGRVIWRARPLVLAWPPCPTGATHAAWQEREAPSCKRL